MHYHNLLRCCNIKKNVVRERHFSPQNLEMKASTVEGILEAAPSCFNKLSDSARNIVYHEYDRLKHGQTHIQRNIDIML